MVRTLGEATCFLRSGVSNGSNRSTGGPCAHNRRGLTLGGMSVESARRVTKLMMSVCRGDARLGELFNLPRWSVEGLGDAQLQGWEWEVGFLSR